MAKIFKRGKNWGIDYLLNGRRKREMVGANRLIAEKVLRKRLTLITENKYLDIKKDKKVKFSEFADQYVELYLKPNFKTWWKSERHNIGHLKNYFGHKFLNEIRPIDIEKFKLFRLNEVGKNSVNKTIGCLKAIFNKAIEWDKFVFPNPVNKVKMFKINSQRTRYLEKEEISTLLSNCEGDLKAIVEFAVNTGMRKSEIFNLKWRDIDFKRGIMFLLKTKNKEIREVPMNEAVKRILVGLRKVPDSPYVFVGKNGNAIVDVKKSFDTALNKSNIRDFRFHDLRHTFASQLVMSGVDLNTVRELLGHKDIKMTLRYSHLSCDHKMRAVGALDGQLVTNPSHQTSPNILTEETTRSYINI